MKAEPLWNFLCLKEVALCRNNEKKLRRNFTEFFFEILLKSPVSRIVPKNVKEGTLLQNIKKKLKKGPFEDINKKMRKKVS